MTVPAPLRVPVVRPGQPTSAADPMLQRCDRHRHPIAPVTVAVSRTLAELFVVHHGVAPTGVADGLAYLDRLRTRHEWLMCECRPDGDQRPMLFPCRRTDNGTLFLRREIGVEHDPACPWQRLTRQAARRREDAGEIRPLRAHLGSPFLLRKPVRTDVRNVPPVRRGGSAGRSTPALARVLFGLLQRAGLNQVWADDVCSRPGRQPGATNPKQQYDRLHCVDNEPVGDTLHTRDLLCTWLPALPDHLVRLRRLRTRFPPSMRPQGLFWGVVDEVDTDGRSTQVRASYGPPLSRQTIVDRLPVATTMPGRCRTGPFWLIAALGAPGDDPNARFEVLDAYAHPAYSRSLLLPVDSDAERRTAALLLDTIAGWHRRHGTRLRLVKPLETFELPDGPIAPPPDFLVELPGSVEVVVETMGALDDPGYVDRKRQTHALMRQIPGVIDLIEHEPTAAGTKRFRRDLQRLMPTTTQKAVH